MEHDFLDSFLLRISNKEQPRMSDLILIAEALVEMNDYGVSFKRAFGLAGKGGATPKRTNISNAFKSMSNGFFTNYPLYLCNFLSKTNQGIMPNIECLEQMACALHKMRDGEKENLNKAFGTLKKTGSKELDITQVSFNDLIRSEKWIIFHDFQNFKAKYKNNKYSYAKPLELMEEKYGMSGRQLENIYSTVKNSALIYRKPIKIKQQELWLFYFNNRKYFGEKTTSRVIEVISTQNQCDKKDVCSKLSALYEEVVIHQKYTMILRGNFDYPKRIKKRLSFELKPIFEFSKKCFGD